MPAPDPGSKASVLFICTHNSARSQIAEGLLRARLGDRYEAHSAGTEKTRVHPLAVKAMQEIDIDVSGHQSKTVEQFLGADIDYVVTVCDHARENCPYFPARRKNLHAGFPDPSAAEGSEAERLDAFRHVRDQIDRWIETTFGETPPDGTSARGASSDAAG